MEFDDESDFEIFSSQPEKPVHETNPSEKKYKFKLIFSSDEHPRKFCYVLKAGTKLPHVARNVGGKNFVILVF